MQTDVVRIPPSPPWESPEFGYPVVVRCCVSITSRATAIAIRRMAALGRSETVESLRKRWRIERRWDTTEHLAPEQARRS